MKPESERSRILWVERAQVLSMLLVTLHHCVPHGYGGPQGLKTLLNAIQYPALACFFLTSGLFADRWRRDGWPAYLKRRFARLMTPYFCVNLLMLPPRYAAARLLGARPRITMGWLARSFLDPHGQGVMPHLWFLPALMLCALLLPALDAALCRGRARRAVSLGALLTLSVLPVRLPTLLCLDELKRYLVCYAAGIALAHARGRACPLAGASGLQTGALGLAAFVLALWHAASPLAPAALMLSGALPLLALAGIPGADPVTDAFRGKTFTVYILSMCAQNLVEAVGYAARLPWPVTAGAMLALGLAVPCQIHRLDRARPFPRLLRLMLGLSDR